MGKTVRLSLCVLMVLFFGCGDEDKSPVGSGNISIVGTWESSMGALTVTYVLGADSSYTETWVGAGFNTLELGAYTIAGTQLSLNPETCYNDDVLMSFCSTATTFAFVLSGNSLTLTDSDGDAVSYSRQYNIE